MPAKKIKHQKKEGAIYNHEQKTQHSIDEIELSKAKAKDRRLVNPRHLVISKDPHTMEEIRRFV
jgi:hypothetical protein